MVETLVRCRTTEVNAAHVADALIAAEQAGQVGHGLRRVPSYAGQALSGKVDGLATPLLTETRPAAAMADAAHGFAYPALMFANTPGAMAPPGGVRPLFGTNPVAFAAPVPGAAPMVVDLSLSTVARGKIMAAAQKGEAIPEGWATDADGAPTTDAKAALGGMMEPAGGAKGAALALMVDVLAAGLTGAVLASDASDFFGADGPPPGTEQLLLAVDPGALGGAAALERIGAHAAGFDGNGTARLPGRRRQQIADQVRADGIVLDPVLAAEIDAPGR